MITQFKKYGLITLAIISLCGFNLQAETSIGQSKIPSDQITVSQGVYQGVIYPEGLNIEQLRKKYPIKMFYDKFGPIEDCRPEPGDVDMDGNPMTADPKYKAENCKIDLMLKRMNEDDIKSLVVNYDTLARYETKTWQMGDYRITSLIYVIYAMNTPNSIKLNLKDILENLVYQLKKNPNSFKYTNMQNFIFSKEILVNLKLHNADTFNCIPQTLPYYKEVVIATVRNWPEMARYLPEKYKKDLDVRITAIEENLKKDKKRINNKTTFFAPNSEEYKKFLENYEKFSKLLNKLKKLKAEGKTHE